MDVFTAIAEPTRRDILQILATQGSLPATSIAKKFRSTPSAISQHLKILREASLIRMEKIAQQRIYTLEPASITQIESWVQEIKQDWYQRLDRLDNLLTKEEDHGKR